jgi:hypothetical protein
MPRRIVAFVRNKSTHLLSSTAYEWTENNNEHGSGSSNGDNNGHANGIERTTNTIVNDNVPRKMSRKEYVIRFLSDTWVHSGDTFRRSLGHETEIHGANINTTGGASASASNSPHRQQFNTSSTSMMMMQRSDAVQLPPTPTSPTLPSTTAYDYENLDAAQALRLFAAPRYATAIFRLVFCSLSCLWALSHFRKASYWPLWVGGSFNGHTKYCWDLSGTVDPSFVLKQQSSYTSSYSYPSSYSSSSSLGHENNYEEAYNGNTNGNGSGSHQNNNQDYRVGISGEDKYNNNNSLDLDFDNQNSALRYFFLGQASYQLQSLCFHFLSMILLLIYGGGGTSNNNNNGSNNKQQDQEGVITISARSSFKSYLRPVIEHSTYFVLTITTFFFSALRRLGSISIFALELSSLVLQLLQICINAPESSRLRNPRVIRFVHHYVAVPVFVYCRFFIIPFVVQYSAAFESSVWLRQIDHAFLPGCGMLIYLFFNGTLILALGLNFVYLRRLIFHPHVQYISKV